MVSVILTPIRFVDNRETPPAKALYYLRESLGQQQVIRMNVERHGRVFSIWYGFIGYPIVYNMRYIQCIAYRSYYVCKPIKDVLYFFVINKKNNFRTCPSCCLYWVRRWQLLLGKLNCILKWEF